MVMVVGEVTSNAHVDYPNVIRETLKHIGYDDAAKGKEIKVKSMAFLEYILKIWFCSLVYRYES